ncbi:hypothetical protein GCM10010201_02780 [Pilimelia columellifera subsp. columellifera]|uniref:Uncharacterized protein n=1 Tax=Pilimelia columellifera subsp. columellifera TaxID=706583 RepID=A0ABP6ADN8_9ACTN
MPVERVDLSCDTTPEPLLWRWCSAWRQRLFGGAVLGAEPATSCGEIRATTENDGAGVPAADRPNAVLPYSVAAWVAQANWAGVDRRGGAVVGAIDGQQPVSGPDGVGAYHPDATVITGAFPATREVYNVLDTCLPSYAAALRVHPVACRHRRSYLQKVLSRPRHPFQGGGPCGPTTR